MLSREILLSDLSLSRSPILKTLPGFGLSKGSKLWPQRSSNFPGPNGRRHLTLSYLLTFSGTKSSTSILELSGT